MQELSHHEGKAEIVCVHLIHFREEISFVLYHNARLRKSIAAVNSAPQFRGLDYCIAVGKLV